jgi:NAD(P)H dehydrogenase (quinone)
MDMNTLIITAHPSSQGFIHKMAAAYQEKAESKGREVRIIDLYKDTKYQQEFLQFEDIKGEWTGQEVRHLWEEQLTWANEVVLMYPMWWFSMPAIVKNFLDNNLTAGFAFSYKGGKQHGLLTRRDMKVFITADGSSLIYVFLGPILRFLLQKGVFEFCGMKVASFDVFTNMRGKRNDTARTALLDKVRKRV